MGSEAIPYGTSETRDGEHALHFLLHLPHPVVYVWAAVATPEGLPQWLAVADLLEPRLGGGVTLRWLGAGAEGRRTVVSGQVTAWERESVAEYTVELHGRVRFHMEPPPADSFATVLRFTNQFRGDDDFRLDCLADWHRHFELLDDALDGRPADWSAWSPDRWQRLREEYARRPSPSRP
ncbi:MULTISPECIES: SRPBCC domain-containing protein [Streptomyces]|uniref:Activator of Hsp90 ATPase homologue 1/2-like C-terminal domain-containing protein n=1 Tax=Streptomyces chengmaiensis TaxID=3040919 RepID=A0ABT6HSS0_9ACTN|nr:MULTISPECIES: SRPBCC domain-containing protein [Streptomyces]MDH2391763.1 hypothetical protein [Streptomyces chengmaiensis]WRQ82024.1 hypothetical protein I3F59_023120 [Streptomyces sp. MUM 178J]